MKKIISLILTAVIALTAFAIPSSAAGYFVTDWREGGTVVASDGIYDLMGLSRAGAEVVDLTETTKFEYMPFSKIEGADYNTKFVRFRFTLKRSDKVTFKITPSKDYRSYCTGVFIFDDDDNYYYEEGFSKTSKTAKTFKDTVKLSKGTYYLFIATDQFRTGTLDVTFSAPKHKEAKPDFELEAKSGGKIKVSWDKVKDATKYRVYKYTTSKKFKLVKTTTKTSTTLKSHVAGNKYSYVVTAYVNGKWTTPLANDVQSINAIK